MSKRIPKEELEARAQELMRIPQQCAHVIEIWRDKKIDVNRDWLHLLSDFARALDCRPNFSIVPYDEPDKAEDP